MRSAAGFALAAAAASSAPLSLAAATVAAATAESPGLRGQARPPRARILQNGGKKKVTPAQAEKKRLKKAADKERKKQRTKVKKAKDAAGGGGGGGKKKGGKKATARVAGGGQEQEQEQEQGFGNDLDENQTMGAGGAAGMDMGLNMGVDMVGAQSGETDGDFIPNEASIAPTYSRYRCTPWLVGSATIDINFCLTYDVCDPSAPDSCLSTDVCTPHDVCANVDLSQVKPPNTMHRRCTPNILDRAVSPTEACRTLPLCETDDDCDEYPDHRCKSYPRCDDKRGGMIGDAEVTGYDEQGGNHLDGAIPGSGLAGAGAATGGDNNPLLDAPVDLPPPPAEAGPASTNPNLGQDGYGSGTGPRPSTPGMGGGPAQAGRPAGPPGPPGGMAMMARPLFFCVDRDAEYDIPGKEACSLDRCTGPYDTSCWPKICAQRSECRIAGPTPGAMGHHGGP